MSRRQREEIADLTAKVADLREKLGAARDDRAGALAGQRTASRQAEEARQRADHLDAAIKGQARAFIAERARLLAENRALRTALDRTQPQLADAMYEPGDDARLDLGKGWQGRRADKPRDTATEATA